MARNYLIRVAFLGLLLGTLGCNQLSDAFPTREIFIAPPTQSLTSAAVVSPVVSVTPIPPTLNPVAISSATPVPSNTPVPTITSTPDPYYEYTIQYLETRAYGGGQIEIVETLSENFLFTRYLIRYPSDELTIYGFLNVPVGEGPFPVIVALHGYVDEDIYTTIDYTTRYADDLAREGYVVFHPNFRNHKPSDEGDNLFRVGMAIDVLNLLELI
jgi:hypothetical protein